MNTDHYDDPHHESAARAAQIAAMSATLLESLARLRATRLAERADVDERAASAARADRLARHAADRLAWTPALDPRWRDRASSPDLARSWCAAAAWSDTDHGASTAVTAVETTLHQRHPEAMAHYVTARAAGLDRLTAMRDAAPLFSRPAALPSTVSEPVTTRQQRQPRILAADGFPCQRWQR